MRAFTNARTVRASIDVTRDSGSDGMIGFDLHAERSVCTSAAGGGADGAPPPAAADGFANTGVDIGAVWDGYDAETTCWGTVNDGAEISLKREGVVVAAARARRDVLTRREKSPSSCAPKYARDGANGDAVGGAPTGGDAPTGSGAPTGGGVACGASSSLSNSCGALGSTDGADGADDASVTVDDRELVRLRDILEIREAELAQLKGYDHELVRLRAVLEIREAELAQLKGLDHPDEETF